VFLKGGSDGALHPSTSATVMEGLNGSDKKPKTLQTEAHSDSRHSFHGIHSTAATHMTSHKSAILHRIPSGAEATTVLVGQAGFLDQPVMAFVRLAKGMQRQEWRSREIGFKWDIHGENLMGRMTCLP